MGIRVPKYIQKTGAGSKIPIERISGFENTCKKGNVLPKYVSKYLWKSGPLKYIQKIGPGSKVPIERISGFENTCNKGNVLPESFPNTYGNPGL